MTLDRVRINYEKVLGDWEQPLREPLLESVYMRSLVNFLHTQYKDKSKDIYPVKQDLFRAFKMTQYKDVRVVILGQDPYPNNRASGLAFGNEFDVVGTDLSPSLVKIKDCIEREVYDGFKLDFDPTLGSWANQGVLLLNSSMSVEKGKIGSHTMHWNRFTSTLLKILSANKAGVMYLLLGAQAKWFSKYINHNTNYVFEYHHPSFSARRDEDWNCPYFTTINKIIKDQNGEEFCIEW